MSETDISQVISSMRNKQHMIIYDFCGMINHIADNYMERGPEFQPLTIRRRFGKYNAKHCQIPKVKLIYWKQKPPISEHLHQHT